MGGREGGGKSNGHFTVANMEDFSGENNHVAFQHEFLYLQDTWEEENTVWSFGKRLKLEYKLKHH